MSIELHCESCGKSLRASRELAGQRQKCPACGHEIYVPTPEGEIEELPLADEDMSERQREEALERERRELERALLDEAPVPDETPVRPASVAPRSAGSAEGKVKKATLAFLVAMRDSDLKTADQAITILRSYRDQALKLVDQLVADQLPPTVLASVPPAVYQGFLRKLRSEL